MAIMEGDRLTDELAALKIDRGEQPRRGLWKPLIYLTILAALGLAGAFVLYPAVSSRVFKTEVEATEIALVSPAQSSIQLTASGYVVPQTIAKVAAKTVGRVARLMVKEGDTVKKGDIIAYLDDSNARSAVATAKARVATARARAMQARAQLAETALQATREKQLAERGVSPKATVDDLLARQRSLAESVKAAEAETAASEAEVQALAVNLADMAVTTPIDGIVTEKITEVGELVGPQAGTLFEIADFATLAVEVDVPEGKLSQVKAGGPAELVLDAFPGRRWRGAVLEIGRKVDRAKATVKVKVRFVDPSDGALPDMAARASFLEKELDAASMKEPPKLIVPERAVVDKDGAKVVYVIDSQEGRLHLTNVQLGDKFGAGWVLKSNLAPGTKVVADATADLRDGQLVKEKKD